MKNIEFNRNRTPKKRSTESILQDSSIFDNLRLGSNHTGIHAELQQMKKAYNETYRSMSDQMIKLREKLQKYKLKCLRLEDANVQAVQKNLRLQEQAKQHAQSTNKLQIINEKLKRKYQYVQGKLSQLRDARGLAEKGYEVQTDEKNQLDSIHIKNQAYREISTLISSKVREFSEEMRVYPMSEGLQVKLESFLEDLVYITPVSGHIDRIRVNQLHKKGPKGSEPVQNPEYKFSLKSQYKRDSLKFTNPQK